MVAMTKLEGVYPILNTTFHEDGSLDLESQASLVQYLLEAGAQGLGLFGNAAEGYCRASLMFARTVLALSGCAAWLCGRPAAFRYRP